MLALIIALGGLLAGAVAATMWRREPADQDEVWFLLVTRRVAAGRRLYAEVFYGAGPLPVWLVLALGRRTRPGLRRLRKLVVLTTVLTAVLLLLLPAASGGSPLLLALAAAALAGPVLAWRPENVYSALARAAALLAVAPLGLAASDQLGQAHAWAASSGLALAAATFAKHPVGLAAGVCVLPGWVVVAGPAAAGLATAALLVGSGATLATLARRRELRGFVRLTLTDKGTYLATGRLAFSREMSRLPRTRPEGWPRDLTAYVVVAAGPPALALSLALEPAVVPVVAALVAISLSGVFPRADPPHVRPSAPPAFVALLLALGSVPEAAATVAAVLALAGAVDLARTLRRRPPLRAPVPVAALDGLPTASPVTQEALDAGREIRSLAGRRVLILRTDAAQWYLALGLGNPTAYDYPLASTFGSRGQREVAQRLRRGAVEWCLLVPADAGPLTPSLLEEAVRTRMDPVTDTALGTLFRARA